MLGIFALAGMIGTPIIAGKIIKTDIEHSVVDNKVKPTLYYTKNNKIIRDEFLNICKRCHMTMNKQGELLDKRECNIGVEYLIYQGFDNEQIELFKKLFNENITDGIYRQKRDIKEKHQKYLELMEDGSLNWGLEVYRKNYYGSENADYRIRKIMENELWNKIVHMKPRYIGGDGTARYMEVYSINAPKIIINDLDNIYKEVCWLQGLEKGRW